MQKQHYYQTPGHVVAAGIGLSVLCITVVTMRFIARLRYKQKILADDWLLLPATVMICGVGVCLVIGVFQKALGHRERTYPDAAEPSMEALEQMSTSIKLEWVISCILPFALGCTKASFIFFYKRLFDVRPLINKCLWGMIGLIAGWAIAIFVATMLCCDVMTSAIWKPIAEMSQCKFFLEILMGFCITGFVLDLAIIAIPIPLVWSLKLKKSHRLVAIASFFLGAVTVACALARLIVSVEFVQQAGDPNNDNILNITLYVYWGMVEAAVGVFAACLPTLQLHFRRWHGWQSLASRTRSIFSITRSSIDDSFQMSTSQENIHVRRDVKVNFEDGSDGHSAKVNNNTYAAASTKDPYTPDMPA